MYGNSEFHQLMNEIIDLEISELTFPFFILLQPGQLFASSGVFFPALITFQS